MSFKSFFSLAWWSETSTPRWQLVVSAIGGAILVTAGTIVSTNISGDHKTVKDARSDQIRQVVNASVQIQTSVSAFTTEFLTDGKIATSTRVDLNKVLNEQFAKVRSIESLLSPDDRKIAEEYLQSLASLVKVAGDVGTGSSDRKYDEMKPFWATLSNVIVSRNKLDKKLQGEI